MIQKEHIRLRIYDSFAAAAEAEASAAALLPPQERIREAVELILRVYGVTQESLNSGRKKLQIKILKQQ